MIERQRFYLYPAHAADDPAHWQSEGAYFLGNDGASAGTAPESTPWYQSLVDTLVPAAVQVYQQRELAKINTQRAQQGLPLLSAQEFAQHYQPPAAQFQVGLTQDAKRLLIIGGALLAGFLLLRATKVI